MYSWMQKKWMLCFRSLWIALRKPLYAPIPYELLLNSTMRTEIDINFKHRDGGNFYPNSFEAFLDRQVAIKSSAANDFFFRKLYM